MKLVRPINVLAGAGLALGARALLPRLLLLKFSGAVAKLNEGDYRPLLDSYADDFVLHFNEGPHRWSGDWVGKEGMDRFLQNFTAAGIQGEIVKVATSGPLWALTMWVRFDDHADAPDGTRVYENADRPGPPHPLGQDRRADRLLRRHRPDPRARSSPERAGRGGGDRHRLEGSSTDEPPCYL